MTDKPTCETCIAFQEISDPVCGVDAWCRMFPRAVNVARGHYCHQHKEKEK